MFVDEPQDVCVYEGSSALFRCTMAGAISTPFWKINGQIYSSIRLPEQHEFNGTGLVVRSADLSMSNSMYSCLYYVETSEGIILQESAQAVLTVHSLDSAGINNDDEYVIIVVLWRVKQQYWGGGGGGGVRAAHVDASLVKVCGTWLVVNT